MRLIARSAALAALLAPALLLADTPATTQWVVTSAHASGGGNDYVTGLRIVNPNASAATVDLYLLAASGDGSGDNSAAPKVTVTVGANSTLAIDDVLASKFGTTGAGGIRVVSTGPSPTSVWVLSQTLVVNAKSSTGVPGTNGFAIPAQPTDQLVASGETAYVPYVSSSTSTSSGYRTNLFLLSANGSGSTVVNVKLLKGDGTVLGTRDVTLAKYGQTQINNIASSFGYSANDTNLTAAVTVTSGGPVATGASVIDNAIASISYSPPVKVAAASAFGNNAAYGILLNDTGFGFSGRLDILGGNGDYMTMAIVVPGCNSAAYVFYFQGFGPSAGTSLTNTSYVRNTDGTISFAGAQSDASFNGTIYSKYDGTVYGNVTYTRASGSAGAPCPGTSVTYPFSGSKAFALVP
jgi:hypothetical protein